jgi:hypothetical protein
VGEGRSAGAPKRQYGHRPAGQGRHPIVLKQAQLSPDLLSFLQDQLVFSLEREQLEEWGFEAGEEEGHCSNELDCSTCVG